MIYLSNSQRTYSPIANSSDSLSFMFILPFTAVAPLKKLFCWPSTSTNLLVPSNDHTNSLFLGSGGDATGLPHELLMNDHRLKGISWQSQ